METLMILSWGHVPQRPNISLPLFTNTNNNTLFNNNNNINISDSKNAKLTGEMNNTTNVNDTLNMGEFNFTSYTDLLFDPNNNGSWDLLANTTLFEVDYSDQDNNVTAVAKPWHSCKEWTRTQHELYQTANFVLTAAFLIPSSFKQSVLLVRALFVLGYLLLSIWAGRDVCSPDLLAWNLVLMSLNILHTVFLTMRFLPPTLTLELTELYLKVFCPLRVSKKLFKELVREAHVVRLEKGDIYAVEEVSSADERLSILLSGKLRVTCDDTHLHFITTHQFVDSPEWEANHEHSDDVFQVTITAEEDCLYLCWSRMRLERVLRHRPMLKTVLDCIIGKDITQKLYHLNQHLSGLDIERERTKRDALWAKAHIRSMSMDAVDTGTTGLVRSQYYKKSQQKHSVNSATFLGSIKGLQSQMQCWIPVVANHFPVVSPFTPHPDATNKESTYAMDTSSKTTLLRVPEVAIPVTPQHNRSFRKKNREVKFQNL